MKSFTITGEWQGSRIDRFVRASFPGTPFGVVQILLRKGLIYLNGEKASGNVRLKAGDVVAINIAEANEDGASRPAVPPKARAKRGIEKRTTRSPHGETRFTIVLSAAGRIGEDISIIYEDDSLLVIDKPAGLVVQPGNRKEKGSLLDALEEYRLRKFEEHEKPLKKERGESPGTAPTEEPFFPYTPVHRLDRETSGVLIVAKTRAAARRLSNFISRGMIRRTYIAIVMGVPLEKTGEISTALLTRKGARSHSSPSPQGKKARTSYTLIKTLPGARALLQISLGTGRTHQIRAHLASIGHPVVGDVEYGAASAASGRIFLHAWKVRFPHPQSGKTVAVTAPPPKEFHVT